jgi:hypothetical protein
MSKLLVVSPAPARPAPLALDPCNGWYDFVKRATKLDKTSFPVEGSFGLCFSAHIDLSSLTDASMKAAVLKNIDERHVAKGRSKSKASRESAARQLITAYKNIKKGGMVALKKGKMIIAIAEITSDYSFRPEQAWGWHSWSYRIIEKLKTPVFDDGLMQTVYPERFPWEPEALPPHSSAYAWA